MNIQLKASRAAFAGARIAAGLLWMANTHWKRPPDFGKSNKSGLFKFVNLGIEHPTFPPFAWMLKHVVVPQMTVFGWLTLITEALLAALLILGWRTPLVALVGVAQSVAIGLSVGQAPNEWPWAYVMMVAVHLLLAAGDAGTVAGLDGLRERAASYRPAVFSLGFGAAAVGLAGLVAASGSPFTSRTGSLVGQRTYELKFLTMNTLSALICLTIGAIALVGWKMRRAEPVLVAAGAAALCALQVVVQWRTGRSGEVGGVLGGNGGTLCLWLVLAIGLGISARRAAP